MPKAPEGEVTVKASDDVNGILHTVDHLPKATRAQGTRSESVKQLTEAIKDGQNHYLAVAEDERDRWRRKLIYAARVADMEVKTLFLREQSKDGDAPGLYFQGKNKSRSKSKAS